MGAALILANIMFPAPSYPYLLSIFMPVAVLAAMTTEVAIFRAFQKGMRLPVVIGLILSANLFSWILGAVMSGVFPTGYVRLQEPGKPPFVRGPNYELYVCLGFAFACVASFALELVFLTALNKWFDLQLEKLPRCVAVVNLCSYVVLALWVAIY